MRNNKAPFLDLILQGSHKQGSTKGYNIIFVTNITERIVEICRSEAVNTVNCDLESLGQVFCRRFIFQIWSEPTAKELLSSLIILMLNRNTSVQNIFKVLCVLTKDIHCNRRVWMHRCDIQKRYVRIHSRFRIYPAALSKIISSIHVMTINKGVSRKGRDNICSLILRIARFSCFKIRINEFRLLLFPKYDSGSKRICRVVYRHSSNFGQDLSRGPVSFEMVKDSFCCQNIVIAILGDFNPFPFRNRLIPWKSELFMTDTEFNLPFFQRLLLGSKVINVRIR